MAAPISSTNVINQTLGSASAEDIKTLLKYVNMEALKDVPDTFTSTTKSAASSSAFFEGIPFLNFLKKSKKISSVVTSTGEQISVKEAMKSIDAKSLEALKNVVTGKEGNVLSRLGNYIKTANESKRQYVNLRDAVKSASKAAKAVSAQNQNPAKIMETINKAVQKADYFVNPAKAESATAKDAAKKAAEALEKNPNSKKLQRTLTKAVKKADKLALVEQGAKQTGKLGKLGKFVKSSGAGFMLVFSGVAECLTEVVPTFQELGKEKGLKQLGKSAIKVIGDTAGFIAGEQAGVAIGTAIGTLICPGIGSAIGSAVGLIGGMVGSWAAGKLTKAITGSTEREIAKQQQEQETISEIANDEAKTEELINAAIARIQEEAELNNGELSEDSQIALEVLQNLETANPFAA